MSYVKKIDKLYRTQALDMDSIEGFIRHADYWFRMGEDGDISRAKITGSFWKAPAKQAPNTYTLSPVVATFTETRHYAEVDKGIRTIRFIGVKEDAELAVYMMTRIHEAVETGWMVQRTTEEYQSLDRIEKISARGTFMREMVVQIRNIFTQCSVDRRIDPDNVLKKRDPEKAAIKRACISEALVGFKERAPDSW